MIDLHSHTDQSDGSSSPAALVQEALDLKLEALGITDHDTLAGYDIAVPIAKEKGLELVCGIELSTRLEQPGSTKRPPSIHLLGYFAKTPPTNSFREWLINWQNSRRERNRKLIKRLNELGVDIQLEEVQKIGRNLTGRPHFAKVLIAKGYVQTTQQAFDKYLAEDAAAGVEREECSLVEGIERVADAGGTPVLAHPYRMQNGREEEPLSRTLEMLIQRGLAGIEVFYSEHTAEDRALYSRLAERLGLLETGGSDYHGSNKPGILLGTGRENNLDVPYSVLERLRQ